LQTLTDAQNHNVGLTYDANGNLDQATNALGRVADSNYDQLNRLSRTLGAMNGIAAEMKFTYDALDNWCRSPPLSVARLFGVRG
jgi:YD repeat-containing protein